MTGEKIEVRDFRATVPPDKYHFTVDYFPKNGPVAELKNTTVDMITFHVTTDFPEAFVDLDRLVRPRLVAACRKFVQRYDRKVPGVRKALNDAQKNKDERDREEAIRVVREEERLLSQALS